MKITGNIIDLHQHRIYHGELTWNKGVITEVRETPGLSRQYILPGFVDAHVHIESSMLVPSEFARLAVVHGTVATVSDPHEIANVLGMEGMDFMLENSKRVPFHFFFGAPSCVPATTFESAGATLDAGKVKALLEDPAIRYLSEMMNYPGVLMKDQSVLQKIEFARSLGKPVDGHAPGVTGEAARQYFGAGISTDHECFTYEEGREKAGLGVKILIREGSAAKNFDALIPLLDEFPGLIMFCSDDKHPDELIQGHINQLVARALRKGCELFDVLKAASLNPVAHYNLPIGTLRVGDPADFIVTDDIANFRIIQTWIGGELVADNGLSLIPSVPCEPVNHFHASRKSPGDFLVPLPSPMQKDPSCSLQVIQALDGQLVTTKTLQKPLIKDQFIVSDPSRDILKFTVVNRYQDAPPALAFIKNFNIRDGAIASCVGHDSHNILAVATDDELLCEAVNLIIDNKGGICAIAKSGEKQMLPLPVAGIMSISDGYTVAREYAGIDRFVKQKLGSTLQAPFMTLSFMALLVIPALKLSDKGLFDGNTFQFADLVVKD